MTKKLIAFIVTATLVAVFVVQQIAMATPLATFDPLTMTLDISGNIGDKAGTPYTVTIAVRSDATPQFSKTNPPLGISMFKTSYNGEVSENIKLPGNFEGGEYTAFFSYNINSEDNVSASHFSYTNANESATIELIKLLNGDDCGDKKGATNSNEFYNILSPRSSITKFGVVYDEVNNESDGINKIPFMCEVTYSMKGLQPDSKFTFETLCNTLFASVAAYDINANGLDSADKHSSYLGELYSKLDELTENEAQRLDSMLKSADYKGRALSDIFAEKYIISKILSADTRLKMKDVLLTYSNELGIDISSSSSYAKVKDERLYIIYEGILNEVSDKTGIADIKTYFDKYVKEALKVPADSNKPSGSRPSGGSTISGSNLTNPNTTATQVPVITPQPDTNKNTVFYDIEGHFSYESVIRLTDSGIISGYTDGSFKPNGNVTRAEFCKIIALAFGIEATQSIDFNDVDTNAWYADYVYALAQNGIITGYDGKFMPDVYITREDAAVIIHRIFTLKNINMLNNEKQFADIDDISSYAKTPIGMLANASIINGDGTKFYPKKSISRGETAVLMCNALDFVEGGSAQ